jgi:hypothetical protein
MEDPPPCSVPTLTPDPTFTTVTVRTTAPSSLITIIAAPIVVTIGALLLLIGLVTVVLVCYKAKKRELYLVKLRSGKSGYQLEDNPRYDSAGMQNTLCM